DEQVDVGIGTGVAPSPAAGGHERHAWRRRPHGPHQIVEAVAHRGARRQAAALRQPLARLGAGGVEERALLHGGHAQHMAAWGLRWLAPTLRGGCMAEIEIGPLADRLGDDELADLKGKLEKLGAPKLPAEDDSGATAVASVDGDVLVEFLDRLEAYDLA